MSPLPNPSRRRPRRGPCPALLAVLLFLTLVSATVPPAVPAAASDDLLTAAESLFQNMAKRNYPALWDGLSDATQRSIARDVGRAVAKGGEGRDESEILADFAQGGPLARHYWSAYLGQFDPRTVLEESRWSLGVMGKDRAEIVLRYRKSRQDTILKLFHERGGWRVGLAESFSTRQ